MLKAFALGSLSVGWHLSHIVRGKPQFDRLSDSPVTLYAFFVPFALALYVKLQVVPIYGGEIDETLAFFLILFANYGMFFALAYFFSDKETAGTPAHKRADLSLLAVLLGVSILFDVAMVITTWLFDYSRPTLFEFGQFFLAFVCIAQYIRYSRA